MKYILALSSTGRQPFKWLEIRNIEGVWNAVGMTVFGMDLFLEFRSSFNSIFYSHRLKSLPARLGGARISSVATRLIAYSNFFGAAKCPRREAFYKKTQFQKINMKFLVWLRMP